MSITDHFRLVVSPRRARHMLDIGNTRLYELLNNKELDSFLDGRNRKITVESIHRLIARRLALTRGMSASPRGRGRPRKIPDTTKSPAVT
jgi:hypothetical protein